MTTSNAAVNTNETAAAKAPSKMELARGVFQSIYKQGYKLSEGCKSQRAEFIKRAQEELALTKNGAATYFQNLTNEAKGESLYKYKGKTTKTEANTADNATGAAADQAMAAANANANKGPAADEIGAHRWMITNAAGDEINSFPSRQKAIDAAKAAGLEWKDRNAK